MRTILIATALFSYTTVPAPAQARFVANDYSNFYEWFHERSQVEQLYADNTQLYIFDHNATVHAGPCRESAIIGELAPGQPVINIAYDDDYYLPEDVINGYGDIWFHVKGKDKNGKAFNGYVWGASIARGWRQVDLTGDGLAEFILLGIATMPRKKTTDINAEIRILQNNRLLYQKIIPGLCVFQECDSSPMLRVLNDPKIPGLTIIEASTMTIGCAVGIEKAFFYWNGQSLDRVFHAEFTTQTEFARKSFTVTRRPVTASANTTVQICQYSHEDENYAPVWTCKPVNVQAENKALAPVVAAN